jgi:class 3 adenylate cyclase
VTRAARFSKAEIANAAKLCREHGVVVKLARDGSMVVFPDTHKHEPVDISEAEDLDRELAAFEAKHGYGRA